MRQEHGRVECDKHGIMAVYLTCLLADPFRSLPSMAAGFPELQASCSEGRCQGFAASGRGAMIL